MSTRTFPYPKVPRMAARYFFLATIAAGSILTAVSLIPGDLEHVAMLERDGRYEDAMAELDRQYANGRRDPRLMIDLHKLKLRFGQLEAARQVLEEYARARPKDIQAQIGLIRFYQMNQQETDYVASLKALNERTRSRELHNELLGYFRSTSRFRDEEDLLDRAARANRAAPADYQRLGLLAASRGDLARAARALRRADGRLDENSQPARLSLFRILLDLKEYDEAHTRALNWLSTWRVTSLVVDFMTELSDAGRVDLSLDIGNRYGGPGSEVTLVAAELLVEQGKRELALPRIKEFVATGLPEDREYGLRLIELAVAADEAEIAVRAARNLGLRKLPGDLVIDVLDVARDTIADATASRMPAALLKGFSAEIEARIANTAPVGEEARDAVVLPGELRLLAAQLAIQEPDLDLARRHLAAIDPDKLDADVLAEWSELQLQTNARAGQTPNLARTLRQQQMSDVMTQRLRLQAARQLAVKDPRRAGLQPGRSGGGEQTVAGVSPVDGTDPALNPAGEPLPVAKSRRLHRKERVAERLRAARRQVIARRKGIDAQAGLPSGAAPAQTSDFSVPAKPFTNSGKPVTLNQPPVTAPTVGNGGAAP